MKIEIKAVFAAVLALGPVLAGGAAQPVRFSGAAVYEPARAAAPRAAGLKAAPMPELPARAGFSKSASDELGVAAEAKGEEIKAEAVEGEAAEAGASAQEYSQDEAEGTLFGACMAGLLGIAIVVGLILLFPAGAMLLVV